MIGPDAQAKWRNIIGIQDTTCEFTPEVISKISQELLSQKRAGTNTASYSNNSTCCLIKPHLVASGMAGAAIYEIQKNGFEINAITAVNFTKPNAEEFLEVYKGVVHEYPEMVEELISGTSFAIEIVGQDGYESFRQLCGPHDPEIARTLRPNTLRAHFGIDKIRNGFHCTDLKEDTLLEIEYFFRILDQ
jgi:nucleoside-diphosphate kinase